MTHVLALREDPVLGSDVAGEYERLQLKPPLAEEAHQVKADGYYQRIQEMTRVDHGKPLLKGGQVAGMVVTNHYAQLYSAADMTHILQMLAGAS